MDPASQTDRLHQSDLMFRLMVENVKEYGIFMLDADGRIATWNAAARRITDYEAVEIIGQPYARLFGKEDAERGRPVQELRQAGAEGSVQAEGWRVRKDGALFWASSVVTALRDDKGRLFGFCNVVRDMTEAQSAKDQLAHSERISTLGRMAGGVAHEFNNVLTAITGLANLIVIDAESGQSPVPDAKQIIAVSEKAAVLVRSLLALGRHKTPAKAPMALASLLEELKSVLVPVLGRRVKIEMKLDKTAPEIMGDRDQIAQIVMNLCLNARDAMPNGGTLRIESGAFSTDRTRPFSHGIAAPGRYGALAVTDSGPGLSKEVREHLFEPFFSTKKDADGSGLGLSVIYQIAQGHGAVIDVPERAGGAEFRLYFPAAQTGR